MLKITYYPNRSSWNSNELKFESNFNQLFTARLPVSGTHVELLEGDKVIGEVDGTYIVLNGNPIKQKRKGIWRWAWVLTEKPELLLWPGDSEYLINNEVVASISESEPPSSNPFDLFKSEMDSSEAYIQLSFKEGKIDPLIAMSLLLVSVSRTFHSI
jgi:hypothetical protein